MYTDNFNKALHFVLNEEGGFVNNPNDSGGATNKGITQSTYNAYRRIKHLPIQSVKGISDSEVSEIYYNNYWLESGADKINDFKLALIVFDTAVNMGNSIAKLFLKNSGNNFDKYCTIRINDYYAIVKKYPEDKEFLQGWLNRVNALKNYK